MILSDYDRIAAKTSIRLRLEQENDAMNLASAATYHDAALEWRMIG